MDCDFSPLKQTLKEEIRHVIEELKHNLDGMDNESHCLLKNFDEIKKYMISISMKAATFYLNCYLAPYTDKYPEVSISVQNMSSHRHGGLIVIERQDPLDSLIKPGIPIEAELTHSLLESIFYPGNPLHDGAVMIKGNKIFSAANVLPLSDKLVIDEKIGTRHRAALGLSERSDALVLVVSEETGRISFGLNGTLYPVHSGDSI